MGRVMLSAASDSSAPVGSCCLSASRASAAVSRCVPASMVCRPSSTTRSSSPASHAAARAAAASAAAASTLTRPLLTRYSLPATTTSLPSTVAWAGMETSQPSRALQHHLQAPRHQRWAEAARKQGRQGGGVPAQQRHWPVGRLPLRVARVGARGAEAQRRAGEGRKGSLAAAVWQGERQVGAAFYSSPGLPSCGFCYMMACQHRGKRGLVERRRRVTP